MRVKQYIDGHSEQYGIVHYTVLSPNCKLQLCNLFLQLIPIQNRYSERGKIDHVRYWFLPSSQGRSYGTRRERFIGHCHAIEYLLNNLGRHVLCGKFVNINRVQRFSC